MNKICERCGKNYIAKDERSNRPSRFCSRACGQPNQKKSMMIRCSVCKKYFERKKYHIEKSGERGQFCSFDCYATWQSKNIKGTKNPFYNPDRHEILTCSWCGVDFSRPKYVRSGKLLFCSRLCFQEFAKENYKLLLPQGYGMSWISIRKRILKRDSNKCQLCGSPDHLVVHHIKEYKTFKSAEDAHKDNNLITLCRSCHRSIHNHPVECSTHCH